MLGRVKNKQIKVGAEQCISETQVQRDTGKGLKLFEISGLNLQSDIFFPLKKKKHNNK